MIISGAIIGILIFAVTIYLSDSYRPLPEALNALVSDENVIVSDDPWISFTPTNQSLTTGFIFYPGGKVEPESYAPLLRQIASAGYFSVIVPMPFNLAVIAPNRATNIVNKFSNITSWVIGGHSLGGSMAARFVDQNRDLIKGLVLFASYPADSNNLSTYSGDVLSIYGTLDGVLSKSINSTKTLLPADTQYVAIEGGNHAYFGMYGEQSGDLDATISNEMQIELTAGNITIFLGKQSI